MKRHQPKPFLAFLAATFLILAAFNVPQEGNPDEAEIGVAAPLFSLPGTDNETYSLEAFQGKFVVLEWLNFGCPYVKRHYNSGNMPELQNEYTDKNVVWLSIVSSAPGKQGYYEAAEMNAQNENFAGQQTAILLDPSGDVGRMYGAKTTPHMYIIDPEGKLIYKGGIDDQPRARESETKNANNYVRAALEQAMNGEEGDSQNLKTVWLFGKILKVLPNKWNAFTYRFVKWISIAGRH